jgi:hypothetical protein
MGTGWIGPRPLCVVDGPSVATEIIICLSFICYRLCKQAQFRGTAVTVIMCALGKNLR